MAGSRPAMTTECLAGESAADQTINAVYPQPRLAPAIVLLQKADVIGAAFSLRRFPNAEQIVL